jgi:hypothetical protein
MFQHLSHVGHVLASAVVKASAAVAHACHAAVADQAGRYRPEAHYMRGPGPKWRAKHTQVSTGHEFRLIMSNFWMGFLAAQTAAADAKPADRRHRVLSVLGGIGLALLLGGGLFLAAVLTF